MCSIKETGLGVYNYIAEVEVRGSRVVKGLQGLTYLHVYVLSFTVSFLQGNAVWNTELDRGPLNNATLSGGGLKLNTCSAFN